MRIKSRMPSVACSPGAVQRETCGPVAHQDDHIDVNSSAALSALIARAEELGGGSAPVDTWNPPDCGPIPMRIAADGTWHYRGSPIGRERLVRLFASILRQEADGSFVLVTPVEKMTIEVEDAPFLAVELAAEGTGRDRRLVLRTNVGDVVTAGPDHPLRVAEEGGHRGFVPYVRVRGRLEARFTRPLALELADLAEPAPDDPDRLGVWSGGAFFPLGRPEGGS
jgi:hypothetical protein